MLQRNRPAPKTRPTPYSVLSGMTKRVLIPYSSGFPGHCFRMLSSQDGCPPHLQINRSIPKFVTIQNSQRTTHATVIDHQTHLHTSADSLQCRSRCRSSTSIFSTTNAMIHSRPSSITSSTSCTMFKPGNLRCHAPI